MKLRSTVFFILSLSVAATSSVAEPSSIGRDRSGKAFRVGPDGVKISDQLADLEVENNELRKQVVTLEDELLEVRERVKSKGVSAAAPALKPAEVVQCPVCKSTDCPLPVAASCPEVSCPEVTEDRCVAFTAPLESRLAVLGNELSTNRSESERTQRDVEENLRDSRADAQRVATQLAALTDEVDRLKRENGDLRLAVQSAKAPARVEPEAAIPSRAALHTPPAPVPAVVETKTQPIVDVPLRQQLAELQKLIIERKSVFDRARNVQKGVSVAMHPLVTKSGSSLDELRVRANQSSSSDEAAAIAQGIYEIRTLVEQDIGVFKRLSERR